MWPFTMQNLREIYRIDEFMSLRDNSRLPPESRLNIEGYCATFFEITKDDVDIWAVFSAALLAQTARFEKGFEERAEPGYPPPAIKTLAYVPYYNLGRLGLTASDAKANGEHNQHANP
jgi:hypothetical protein